MPDQEIEFLKMCLEEEKERQANFKAVLQKIVDTINREERFMDFRVSIDDPEGIPRYVADMIREFKKRWTDLVEVKSKNHILRHRIKAAASILTMGQHEAGLDT